MKQKQFQHSAMAEELNEAAKVNYNDYTEMVDPHCVAENPVRVTFQDITSASYLIKSGIEYTPCTVNW